MTTTSDPSAIYCMKCKAKTETTNVRFRTVPRSGKNRRTTRLPLLGELMSLKGPLS